MTPCSFGEPGSMIQVVTVPEGLPPDALSDPLSSPPPQPATTSAAIAAHAAAHPPAFIAFLSSFSLGRPHGAPKSASAQCRAKLRPQAGASPPVQRTHVLDNVTSFALGGALEQECRAVDRDG